MRHFRRLLSYALLATYAGVSLLGEGLHALLPEGGHHHHHGVYIVSSAGDEDGHVHECEHGRPAGPVVAASDDDSDSHICEICEFLFQAVGQPRVAAVVQSQPLVVAASTIAQPIYLPVTLGPQAARGPPVVG